MMRKFKALYLMIILGVVWVGAGVASYFLLLSPELDKQKKASEDWNTAYQAVQQEETKAKQSETAYTTNATLLIDNYRKFNAIAATMPRVYNMDAMYKNRQREGLNYLYETMVTGRMIGEIERWMRGYPNLRGLPGVSYAGTLGYEDTFTSVKTVQVDFGTQTLRAYGYADLINKFRKLYGYRHFPLIIKGGSGGATASATAPGAPGMSGAPSGMSGAPSGMSGAPGMNGAPPPPPVNSGPVMQRGDLLAAQAAGAPPAPPAPGGGAPGGNPSPGAPGGDPAAGAASSGGAGSFTITVHPEDPRHTMNKPSLTLTYSATGAFFTRGWDPNGELPVVRGYIDEAKVYKVNPPKLAVPIPPSEYPKILWFFGASPIAQ